MNRQLWERWVGQDNGTYAWIADVWPVTDGFQCEPTGHVDVGPADAPQHLIERLRRGEGETYRVLDDDGIPYWEGRIIIERESPDAEAKFRPLHDLGEAYGCATIQYRTPGGTSWESL